MKDRKTTKCDLQEGGSQEPVTVPQTILVLQQQGSAESKVKGIKKYGGDHFILKILSIDEPLPSVVDDGTEYLPNEIRESMVLDFLKHPDLSQDLAVLCLKEKVPLVASGKKLRTEGAITPPT